RGTSDQRLLNAARAFLRDARPLAKSFIAHDMPVNFLSDLRADIDAFEQATRDRTAGKDTHIAARAGIESAMEAGLTAVQRLDAIMANSLREDPQALAVWNSARHVEYTQRGKNGNGRNPITVLVPGPVLS